MALSAPEIKRQILVHINLCGGSNKEFYVGITNDINQRLFGDHKVDKDKDCYIFRKAINIDSARIAEKTLIAFGLKGGSGGGDDDSIFVYCYKITTYTNQ